jgi:GTP-binding protein
LVRDSDSGKLIGDTAWTEDFVVARGGAGGRGNAAFATATDRAPRRSEQGRAGEELSITLELKVIADVGLVGRPNVGKSTLLRSLTRARPRVAPYPFTTLRPFLGVASHGGRELVLADIPGLIEGAHSGKGLGHAFLRHIERTKALVLIVDAAGGSVDEQLEVLSREIGLHDPGLLDKPRLVAANKVDLIAGTAIDELQKRGDVLAISALTGYGLEQFVALLFDLVEQRGEGGNDGREDRS